jgi:hypothetical protein
VAAAFDLACLPNSPYYTADFAPIQIPQNMFEISCGCDLGRERQPVRRRVLHGLTITLSELNTENLTAETPFL